MAKSIEFGALTRLTVWPRIITQNCRNSFPGFGTLGQEQNLTQNFFVQNLTNENCLVAPPLSLVGRVLHYLSIQKAKATLIVAMWPSFSFWPLLTPIYRRSIQACVRKPGYEVLKHGRNKNSLLGSRYFFADMLTIRIEF